MVSGLTACGGGSDDSNEGAAPVDDVAGSDGQSDGSDDSAGTADDATDTGDGSTDGSTGASDEVLGTVTVDGVAYEITTLRNCDPLDEGPIERELELQGLGDAEGERVQIDVYVQRIGGNPFDDVSWSGPEGVFGNPADARVEISADGTSVTGSATLDDAMTQTETIDVEFDLAVPADTISCR